MDEQLRSAIAERISLGFSKIQIVNELVEAGYDVADSRRLYDIVAEEEGVAGSSTTQRQSDWSSVDEGAEFDQIEYESDQVTPPQDQQIDESAVDDQGVQAMDDNEMVYTEEPETFFTTTDQKKRRTGLILSVVVALSLAGVFVAAILLGWYRPLLSTIGIDFPPYDEVTLLPGVVAQLIDVEQIRARSEFALFLEEPDMTVAAGPDEMFEALGFMMVIGGMFVPDNAHLKLLSDFKYDHNQKGFDVQTEMDVFFEPLAFKAGGSLRLIDGTLYGRIDRLPAMARNYFLDDMEVPTNQWIELWDTAEITDESFLMTPQLQLDQSLDGGLPADTVPLQLFYQNLGKPFSGLAQGSFFDLFESVSKLAVEDSVVNENTLLAASAGSLFTDLFYEEMDEEEQAQLNEVFRTLSDAWQQFPLIAFAEDPYKTTVDGEEVYVYEVVPAIENIEPFLLYVLREAEDNVLLGETTDSEEMYVFLSEELPEVKEELERMQDFYTLRFNVRPDGSLQAILLDVAIRSEAELFPHQFRMQWHTYYIIGEPVSIDIPNNIYEKTLEEIMLGSMQQTMLSPQRSDTEMIMMEITDYQQWFYIDNQFSYTGFCEDPLVSDVLEMVSSLAGVETWCAAAEQNFVIMAELSDVTYYCLTESKDTVIEQLDSEVAWWQCQS